MVVLWALIRKKVASRPSASRSLLACPDGKWSVQRCCPSLSLATWLSDRSPGPARQAVDDSGKGDHTRPALKDIGCSLGQGRHRGTGPDRNSDHQSHREKDGSRHHRSFGGLHGFRGSRSRISLTVTVPGNQCMSAFRHKGRNTC